MSEDDEAPKKEGSGATGTIVQPPVLFLAGATAVGKTAVALELAESLRCETISIDSRQIYRELEIGTAKPTGEERRRAPHHLVDLLDPRESCSAGQFRSLYRDVLEDLSRRRVRAIAVGGTGLYWEACTRGLHPLPPVDRGLRAELEAFASREGVEALYAQLVEADPAGATRVPPQNRQRVMRALELVRQTGHSLSEIYRGSREGAVHGPIPTFFLRRDRVDLFARIDARCDEMLEAGLLGEVRSLLNRGIGPDAPGMRTLGYREMAEHLGGGQPWEEARAWFHQRSRQYGKRQETWFRYRLPEAREIWIAPAETAVSVAERIAALSV